MKTLKMMTDEELVVLYAEGNNAAFDILLNRYKSSIHSYIYFIVRNKELTEIIDNQVMGNTSNPCLKLAVLGIATLFNNIKLCDGTIEDNIVRHQVLSDVKKLVKHLPDNQREVLEMRYYQDLSFKEIADITGVSINTALGRMRYAILNMRRMADENRIELSMV